MKKIIQKITVVAVLSSALIAQPVEAMNKWFKYAAIGATVFGVGYGFYNYYKAQVEKQNKKKEEEKDAFVKIYQPQLIAKINELKKTCISHKFDTDCNDIMGKTSMTQDEFDTYMNKFLEIEKQDKENKAQYYKNNKATLIDDLCWYVEQADSLEDFKKYCAYFTTLLNPEDVTGLLVAATDDKDCDSLDTAYAIIKKKQKLEVKRLESLQFDLENNTYRGSEDGNALFSIWNKCNKVFGSVQSIFGHFDDILNDSERCAKRTKYAINADKKIVAFMINDTQLLSKQNTQYSVTVMSQSFKNAEKLVKSLSNEFNGHSIDIGCEFSQKEENGQEFKQFEFIVTRTVR